VPSLTLAILLAPPVAALTAWGQESPVPGGRRPDYDTSTRTTEYAGPGREIPAPPDLREVRIGYFGPADPAHTLGGDLWLAVTLAVEQANTAGGIHGLPVTLVPAWSEEPWGTGVSDLARLAYEDRIWAILGSIDGETTHLAETVVAKARLPLLSFAGTDKTVNLANVPWIFAGLPQDDRLAPVVARAVLESSGGEPFTIVSTTDHDSHATIVEIGKVLDRQGAAPLYHHEISPGEEALADVVGRLPAGGPAALLVVAGPLDSARLVRAVREAGLDLPITGGPSFGRRPFLEGAGPAAEGVLLPLLCDPGHADGSFARVFRQRTGHTPDCSTAQAYDTARLLLEAARAAGLNRARIRDRIAGLSAWTGTAGDIRWNGLGQNQRAVLLATVQDGKVIALGRSGEGRSPEPPLGKGAGPDSR
jgi:ABC-type branched-subunit amino acid transport system substrate-binding protein